MPSAGRRSLCRAAGSGGPPAGPNITSYDPTELPDPDSRTITLTGTNLQAGTSTVTDPAGSPITITDVSVADDTSVDVVMNSVGASAGVHTLTYTNDDGSDTFDITVI